MSVRIIIGDARERLKDMPDRSVHCCVTSPPYFGLRDYGTAKWEGGDPACGHKQGRPGAGRADGIVDDRAQRNRDGVGSIGGDCRRCGAVRIDGQIGLEATPDAFVAEMVAVFREVRRVLRDDGTLWLNLGDSYANDTKWGGQTSGKHVNALQGNSGIGRRRQNTGLKSKDLIGIPWRVAFALQQPYYTGKIKSLEDRVWLAAIIDGEGCFFIHKRKAGASAHSAYTRADGSETNYLRTADTYGVGLEICNTSKAIIDRVSEIVPGGTFTTQGSDQNSRRRQTIYRWRISPTETKRIAQELYPHLIAKQHQARLIVNCPSNGEAGAAAHQAMMNLHNGVGASLDFPAPPSMFETGYYLRQDIIWGKPNPMPESVTDRCTKAHEYIFLLSKSARYYYDAGAIAEPVAEGTIDRLAQPNLENQIGSARVPGKTNGNMKAVGRAAGNKSHKYVSAYEQSETEEHRTKAGLMKISGTAYPTRNKRSVWEVSTQPFSEAHFATFPPDLIEPCIKAGCPVGGTVLDPFGGAGTTGLVADRFGRDAILIELNPEYAAMAQRRIEADSPLFSTVGVQDGAAR